MPRVVDKRYHPATPNLIKENIMAAAKQDLVKSVVRKGTVFSETVSSKGWDHVMHREIDIVKAAGQKGPGEIVHLPAAETERLTKLGFLKAPDETEADSGGSMLHLLDRSEVGYAQKGF
jgi:hypothetical protein